MADMAKEDTAEVNRLAEPREKENEILAGNPARDAALKKAEEAKVEDKLPKLSAAEFRVYNSMAEHMEYFVPRPLPPILDPPKNRLRHQPAPSQHVPKDLPQHRPLLPLAPRNAPLDRRSAHLPCAGAEDARVRSRQERGRAAAPAPRDHAGMETLGAYLRSVRSGERELELGVMRERMEVGGWGDVLWTHLDQEVRTLGAENMRKYWTLEEMKRMPM
ncbi:hypothetical protein LARI1_G003808 [Lachnellula arida]|uniref:Uncharacterized protein n=1 Tax=Lachnellula arida TaxID=1316785 RepID=A0A8T9B8G4_9HELO|nr:hypothetical protein LARI1_G003808 [Lachnellula arida]